MLILRKDMDIKDAIYSPMIGRIYNDTWESRKTAENPIWDIVDIMEHVARLQCWSESSPMPSGGWGKGYATGARINTGYSSFTTTANAAQKNVTLPSGKGKLFRPGQYVRIYDSAASEYNAIVSVAGDVLTMENNLANTYASGVVGYVDSDGSYDSPLLSGLRSQTELGICHQIQDYDDGWTDDIKRSICRDYQLLSWTDKYGYECVKKIEKSSGGTQDTVTLGDIVDRSRVKVVEPAPDQLYAEPFLRYQIDYGSGDTQKIVAIRGAGAAAFDATYAEGVSAFLGEQYWNQCQNVWSYSKELAEPPSSLSDLTWVNGSAADGIAQSLLGEKINWMMNPRIEVPLHFSKAGAWEEGHTFTLTLPHQTAKTAIDCIVSRVSINPNAPYDVVVTAYMWRETIPEDYDIIDTMVTYGDDRDWLDNTTEYGTSADKIDNM